VTSHKVSSSFRFAARSCPFYYSPSLSPHGPPGSCDACTRPSTCNTICCTLHPIVRAAFYSVCRLSSASMHPLIFHAWTPPRPLPAGGACRQSQAAKGRPHGERAAHVGRDQGPEEVLPHLTSTYITRDIARCRPLALHYRCMKLKGPSNGLNALNPRPGKLSSSSRSINGMHTFMTALTRGLPSFPITSQSHPTSPDCTCMASLYMASSPQPLPFAVYQHF
jgi:hypothetical protein